MKRFLKYAFVAAFATIAGYGAMLHRNLILCLIWLWLMWRHWPHLVKRRAIIVIVIFHKMSVNLVMTIIDLSAMHPLIVSRMSLRSHFLLLVCFSFLVSCQFAGNKKGNW